MHKHNSLVPKQYLMNAVPYASLDQFKKSYLEYTAKFKRKM